MTQRDSIDKIVGVYLAAVCTKRFEYKGERYAPRPLQLSPLVFRGFTCPCRCGGCCPRFTLDYLPTEAHPYPLKERHVVLDGRRVAIWSDVQDDHREHFCRNLDRASGRCLIHENKPFSCDFELIRFIVKTDRAILIQKLFGRGWAMLRVDGEHGALCEMVPATEATCSEVLRKMYRLEAWANHFNVQTCLTEIIDWIREGPHQVPLLLHLGQ